MEIVITETKITVIAIAVYIIAATAQTAEILIVWIATHRIGYKQTVIVRALIIVFFLERLTIVVRQVNAYIIALLCVLLIVMLTVEQQA